MARLFVDASTQSMQTAATSITAIPFTVALWFNNTDSDGSETLWSLSDIGATDQQYAILSRSDNTIDFSVRAGGSFLNATSSGSTTDGVWHHVTGVATSSTLREVYLDGTDVGQNTTSATPSGIDNVSIGVLSDFSPGANADAKIAECGMWNVALSTSEIASLAEGYSPLLIRPASLVYYWPIMGNTSPEPDFISGEDMVLTNAPTKAEHTRIIRPSKQALQFPAAADSGSFTIIVPKGPLF